MMTSEHDIAQMLQGIQDSAIDENFPPTAQDAAELEAVQAFVEMMAQLAFLEENEEQDRMNFVSFDKRWECRRAEGLVGKPHAAKGLVQLKDHSPRAAQSIKTLAKATQMHPHPHTQVTVKPPKASIPKNVKHSSARHPIQQPRKLN